MSSQVRTKTTKNKATLFPKNSYKNGGGPPKPTPEQLAELARKQMLEITAAESYVRRLGNFYPKEDVESVRKSRVSNITNTPIKYIDFSIAPTQAMYTYGSDLIGQPKNAQIEIYKDSKDNITTYLHELVHASTMSNRGLNKGEQDYIKSRVKKPADGSERDWYVTDGTEVLARKAVVAKWAADNGIIDINNDVDENTFNLIGETLRGKKDKQSKEVLRHYNELLEATGNKPKNVIDIWNTVAQVDTNNEDLPPIAKNGGTPKILTMKKTKYKQGGKPNTLNIGGIPNAQTGGATNPFGYYGGAGDMLTSIFGNVSGSGLFKPQTGTYNQMSSSDYLNQNKYSTPYSKKDWLGNTTVYVKDASGNEVKYKDVYKDYQGYNKQAAEDFSTNQKQFNEMLPVGIQLAGLMDLQMKEQDEIANKKMTVQDFPTTAATYAPVGFAEEGGGVGMQQEMFPALKALKYGLPKEMPKKARKQVEEAAEEEVQVLEQMLGYRDDSPFRNKSSINIYSDTIDMGQKGDGTGTPLLAVADNGDSKILKPYSGTHFFPGASMVTEVPIAQNGGPTTHQDSVAHQANKILKYEQLKGGPGGAPLPSYADPRYLKMLMQDILPEVDKIMPNASAMEKAEAMDFVFNAGYDKTNKKITKDPRAYAIQEYYRKYDPSKLDKDGKWSGRKGAAYSFDDEYSNTIGRLPENERRVFMNMGRDWYYKNIENPAPGVYSPNYEDTWYGRIWNTNDYNEFDPNATKLVHPNKRKPQKRVNGGPSSPIPFIPSAVRIDPFDEKLKSLIKKHEGSVTDKQGKHVAYADSLGYQTIGYGHLMRGVEAPVMSQSAVDDLFNKDYQTHKSWAQKMPGFNNFSDSQKAAIIDMTFNLGDNWWEEFPRFTKALNQGDTNEAAQELRSSLWAKQVGPRADEVINLLQNKGNFQQGGQPTIPAAYTTPFNKKVTNSSDEGILSFLDAPQKELMKYLFNEYKRPSELMTGEEVGSKIMGTDNYGFLADLVLDPLNVIPYSKAKMLVGMKGEKVAKNLSKSQKAVRAAWAAALLNDVEGGFNLLKNKNKVSVGSWPNGGQPTPNNNNEITKLLGMNKYQIMPSLQMLMQQGGFTRLKSADGDPYQYEYDSQNDDYYVITPEGKTIKVKKGSTSDAAIRKRYQSGWKVQTKSKYKDNPYYDAVVDPKREKYLMPKDGGTPSDSTDYYSEYYDDKAGGDKNGFYRRSDADGGARALNPEEAKKAKAKFRDRYGYNSVDPINGYIGIDGVDDYYKYNPVTGDIIEETEEWDDTLGKPVKVRKKVRGDAYNKMRDIVRKKGVATGLVPADDEYTKREDNFFGRMYNKWLFQDGGQPTLNNILSNLTGISQDYTDVVSDEKDPYEYRYDANTDTWETRLKGKGKKWIKVKGDSKRMVEADVAIRGRYDKQLFPTGSKAAALYSNGPTAPQVSIQLVPTKVSHHVRSINDDSNGFRDSKASNRSNSRLSPPTTSYSDYQYNGYQNYDAGYYDGDVMMSPSMIRYDGASYKKDKLIGELIDKLTSSYNPTPDGLTVFNPMNYRRKYANGGKVMQNYMPVGNGKTKVHGFIDLASLIPIQTEKKELIVLPDGNLVPVNAKKRHSQMSDDEVTDIVPENSYILSQFGSVDIYKSEADQIQMEVENKPYNMYGPNPTPKVKTLGDIMRKKVMKPADMARLVEQKYKIMDHDDPFTIQTNAINKHRRGDYLQAIIQLSEYDKARKGIDNSIETQLSQDNQQPPQMVASNGGKVLRSGYGVPKAQVGLIANAAASLIGTGVSAYQNWKARQRADKLMNQQLGDISGYESGVRKNLGLGLGIGAATTLLQDPTINPAIESDQFISQLPSYVNASNNVIFEGNRNSLYANRPDTSSMTPQMAMLLGERYNAQTTQAQGQLAGQLAGQRANTFAQYLQARQSIFNKNSASRTAATNATRTNQNNMMTTLGGMGMGYFDNLNNLSGNVLNARAAARGQNTAAHIQLGNQMSQTINNGLASGLQAYNSYMAAQPKPVPFANNPSLQNPSFTFNPQLPPPSAPTLYPQTGYNFNNVQSWGNSNTTPGYNFNNVLTWRTGG